MRHRLVSLLAAFALVGGTAAVPVAPATASSIAPAKHCGPGYRHGWIGPRGHKAEKCLRAGEFCVHRYNAQYHQYGFNCTRYYRNVGRYRLTHRY